MTAFTPEQWLMIALIFVLGLVIGMYALAGGKWKRRYRDEVRLREEADRERDTMRRDLDEHRSLRADAADSPGRRATDPPRPL